MDIRPEDKIRLLDIADSIREIQGYLQGTGFEEFAANEDVQQSVVNQLSFIGGAAALLSDEFKEQFGNIDWDILKGFQYAHHDQALEMDSHELLYVAQRDLPEVMDDILDVATMAESDEDLEEDSLNAEDKLDLEDMQRDKNVRSKPKAEEVFYTDDEEPRLEDYDEYDEEDDSLINRRYEDSRSEDRDEEEGF
jgi:uncharacterized protein with HEPN domain